MTSPKQRLSNHDGVAFANRGEQQDPAPAAVPIEKIPVEKIEGACPGIAGRVRLRYGLTEDLRDAMETASTNVNEVTDNIHQF